jgi:hypothetical protein
MSAMDRQRRGRRYRAIVRWVAGVFVLSQLTIAIAVDQGSPNVRDPEYAALEKMLKERIAERPRSPTAVFLGSSRVAYGFDAEKAAGSNDVVTFNFGVPGAGPYLQGIVLERFRRTGIKPDALFLEVLHTFYNAAGPRSLDHGLLDGARLSAGETAGLLSYGCRSQTGPIRRWAFARALPLYRHQAELRDNLDYRLNPRYCEAPESFRTCDRFGFRPQTYPPDEWPALVAIAHDVYDPFYKSFEIDPHAWGRLLEIIRSAQGDGMHVVCVMMPEGSEFRRMFAGEPTQGPGELARRLKEEVHVPVIDARDWLDDSAFFDQHHLLPHGAAALADRFRKEAVQPALERVDRRIAAER